MTWRIYYVTLGNFHNFKVLHVAICKSFSEKLVSFNCQHKRAIPESFLHEIIFFTTLQKFSLLKVSRYTVARYMYMYITIWNLFFALATRNWHVEISMPTNNSFLQHGLRRLSNQQRYDSYTSTTMKQLPYLMVGTMKGSKSSKFSKSIGTHTLPVGESAIHP